MSAAIIVPITTPTVKGITRRAASMTGLRAGSFMCASSRRINPYVPPS
jgi:hypothetical protein